MNTKELLEKISLRKNEVDPKELLRVLGRLRRLVAYDKDPLLFFTCKIDRDDFIENGELSDITIQDNSKWEV